MMEKFKRLPDAELDVMKELWAAGGPSPARPSKPGSPKRAGPAPPLLALLSRAWKPKGFVARQKAGQRVSVQRGCGPGRLSARREPLRAGAHVRRQRQKSGRRHGRNRCPDRKDLDELADYLAQLKAEHQREE